MDKVFLLLCLLFLSIPLSRAQIFVDADAAGSNDGSSWTNAFVDLQSALLGADPSDEIWVAEGIYRPGPAGSPEATTFTISFDLALYGGFEGTESQRDQRDPLAHPTVLSGDLSGNDVDGVPDSNRTDNILNILTVKNTVSKATLIDGFIFRGGQADGLLPVLNNNRGGAIYCEGPVAIRNCRFEQNVATAEGGAVYFFFGQASGARLERCVFQNNYSLEGGALATSLLSGEGLTLRYCSFQGNQAVLSGGAALFNNSEVTADTCSFLGNSATISNGGAVLINNSQEKTVQIRNSEFAGNNAASLAGAVFNQNASCHLQFCRFENNAAGQAGGAFLSLLPAPGHLVKVESCLFTGNRSTNGGAVYLQAGSSGQLQQLQDCRFENNRAVQGAAGEFPDGGAVRLVYDNFAAGSEIQVGECIFFQNFSEGRGGAISNTLLGANNNLRIEDCLYENNASDSSFVGGALYTEFLGLDDTLRLKRTTFRRNFTNLAGGAYVAGLQESSGLAEIDSCLFEENTSVIGAGLIAGNAEKSTVSYRASGCSFVGNQAVDWGGGIVLLGLDSSVTSMEFDHCAFQENTAGGLGAAVGATVTSGNFTGRLRYAVLAGNQSPFGSAFYGFPLDPDRIPAGSSLIFDNCLATANQSPGGTFTTTLFPILEMQNSTIANNQGDAFWMDSLSTVTIQNTILYNPGFTNLLTFDASARVISEGGNLASDNSLDSFLLASDLRNLDPLFLGSGDYPFQLSSNSPCIDAGILPADAPMEDLAGNQRLQGSGIDMGAFESPFAVEINEKLFAKSEVRAFPNPVQETLTLVRENGWPGNWQARFFNSTGQTVLEFRLPEGPQSSIRQIPTRNLPAGIYYLILTNGTEKTGISVVKD